MPDEALRRVRALLEQARSLLLTTHVRPDGDALGSEVGLALFLRSLGKHVRILNCDDPPPNLSWLGAFFPLERYRGEPEEQMAVREADLIVVLDVNALHRLEELAEPVRTSPAGKVVIDHHLDPEPFFQAAYIRSEAAATCELVFDVLEAWDPDRIDQACATALYTGLMTDTGSFRYDSVTPRVHEIAAELLRRGCRPAAIHERIFDQQRPETLRLLGHVLGSVEVHKGGRFSLLAVRRWMLEETGADYADIEGFVNYGLSLRGVEATVLMVEHPDYIRLSFRSKTTYPVNEWAKLFGGGGHRNAAGGRSLLSWEATRQRLLETFALFEPQPASGDLGQS
ncbi:MAG: bifunctional oligoribonuclease/PAP phosphatase NrnA [Bacteroidetes bacterium]|nr:bifunctional oligoribonuclease/PAP phosphatase NrnA [Bacteroidota bacterium]